MAEIGDTVVQHLFIPHGAPRRFVVDNEFDARQFHGLLSYLGSTVN